MEELIARISSAAGIEEEVASKSVGIILNFLRKEGPSDAVAKVMAAMPGAEAAANAHDDGEHADAGSGLMGLANQLSHAGLGMGDMQAVGKELFAAVHEKAGADAVGEIAASIPGLHQFI